MLVHYPGDRRILADLARAMAEQFSIPTPGDLVAGKYLIQEELGRGAYGVVFRARQQGIERDVALKTLLPGAFLQQDIVERFQREALLISRLQHPNIVTLFDFGQSNGTLYMAMEMIEGEPLKAVIDRDTPVAPERAVHIIKQICRALHVAHKEGIVHRDLKPENIILTRYQEDPEFVKVLDFGIAKIQESTSSANKTLTVKGYVLGTPHYMSPENITGEVVTEVADLYSVGILLYELLTGVHPFDAPTPSAVLVRHLQDPVPVLPDPKQESSSLGTAIQHALVKDPDARVSSALEFIDILDGKYEADIVSAEFHAVAKERAESEPEFEAKPESEPEFEAPTAKEEAVEPVQAAAAAPSSITTASTATASIAALPPLTESKTRERIVVGILVIMVLVLGGMLLVSSFGSPPTTTPIGQEQLGGDAQTTAQTPPQTTVVTSGSAVIYDFDPEMVEKEHSTPEIIATSPSSDKAETAVPKEKEGEIQPSGQIKVEEDEKGKEDARAAEKEDKKEKKKAATVKLDAPAETTLRFVSDPPGAQVTVNSMPAGVTPCSKRIARDAGPARVSISKIGYKTESRTIELKNRKQSVSIKLKPGRIKLSP